MSHVVRSRATAGRLMYALLLAALSRASPECLDPRNFGAVEGNPGGVAGPHWKTNTAAIQTALDRAGSGTGSSCVELQGGAFVSADLWIRSNTQFSIQAGSTLLNAVNQTGTSMLHVSNVTNVTLWGGGTVYGNAEHYIAYFDPVDNRFEPRAPDGKRPHLLIIEDSSWVTVKGLSFRNSTDWNLWVRHSADVLIDGVSIVGDQRFPNNDGIEPDSCTRLTILNSHIDVADDGISPISSVQDGPMTQLLVRNVTIRSKSHAIKFGSTCSADCTDVLFENITIWDSNSGLAIQQRGAGNIRNVTFRDIKVQTRYQAPRWWGNGEWLSVTVEPRFAGDAVGNTSELGFHKIQAESENGGLLSGLTERGIHDVVFDQVQVVVKPNIGNYSQGTGPPCCVPGGGANITCMGTIDHRPSFVEDVNCTLFGNCRTSGKADGLRLENVHGAVLQDVDVRFEGDKPWFGECVSQHVGSTGVVVRGSHDCTRSEA